MAVVRPRAERGAMLPDFATRRRPATRATTVMLSVGASMLMLAALLFAAPTAAATDPSPSPSPTPTPTLPPLTAGGVLGSSVTFYGRGYGHGVGLSQWGARGRAEAG